MHVTRYRRSEIEHTARGIALGEGFGLHFLVCDDPMVARSAAQGVVEQVEFLLGHEIRATSVDPYQDVQDSLSFEDLVAAVLEPMVRWHQAEDDSRGSIVIIDLSWAPQRDMQVWHRLFRRLNEVRNTVVKQVAAALLWVLPAHLYQAFAIEAPDFWSIRSSTLRVDAPGAERLPSLTEAAGGWSRNEIIGHIEAMSDAQLTNLIHRLHLPADEILLGHRNRSAQALHLVSYLEERHRLGELATILSIEPAGSFRKHLPGDLYILHLAGLTISKETKIARRAAVRELLADVDAWLAQGGLLRERRRVDLVCVSGDLASSGRAKEYSLLARLVVEPLMNALSLPRERLFWVPGDHDVDRRIARLRGLDNPDEVDALLADPGARERAFAHLRSYAEFTRSFFGALIGDQDPAYHVARTVEIGGARVGIACLNSAWHATGTHKKRPWLGRRQLVEARRKIADTDIRIALLHHPFHALDSREAEAAARFCEREFDIVLHNGQRSSALPAASFDPARAARTVAGISFHGLQQAGGFQVVYLDLQRRIAVDTLRLVRPERVASRARGPVRDAVDESGDAASAELALDILARATDPEQLAPAVEQAVTALENTVWEEASRPIPRDRRAAVVAAIEKSLDSLAEPAELPRAMVAQVAESGLRFSLLVDDDERRRHVLALAYVHGLRVQAPEYARIRASLRDTTLEGVDALLAALTPDTHPWRRRLLRFLMLIDAGQYQSAGDEILALAAEYPGRSLIDSAAAAQLVQAGKLADALAHARRAFRELPGFGQRCRLLQCLVHCGQPEEAWALVEPMLASGRLPVLALGAQAAERVRPDQALNLWQHYLERVPDDAHVRLRLAQVLFELGRPGDAADEAWRAATGPGNETLSATEFFHGAILQQGDIATSRAGLRTQRIIQIAEILRARFAGDPHAESYLMRLWMASHGRQEMPRQDFELFQQAGWIRQATGDEVEIWQQQWQRYQEFAKRVHLAYRRGLVSLSATCRETGRYESEYIAHVARGREFFATFEMPPLPGGPVAEGHELLLGILELLLLHELGLLPALARLLRTSGRLLLFEDVGQRIHSTWYAYLQRPPQSALESHLRLKATLEQSGRVHMQPESALRELAARDDVTVVMLDSSGADTASTRVLTVERLIERLALAGYIDGAQLGEMSTAVQGSAAVDELPVRIAVDRWALGELHSSRMLDAVVEKFPGHIDVCAREWLEDRQSTLEIQADAAERAAAVQQWVGEGRHEGWVQMITRPDVDGVPDERPGQVWARHCRAWITEALSCYEALRHHPERRLASADFFVTAMWSDVIPAGTLLPLEWDGRSYTAIGDRLAGLRDQLIDFPSLALQLAGNPAQVKRELARLGFLQAVDAAEISSWARSSAGLDDAADALDGIERIARTEGHSGRLDALASIAALYAGAIWQLWRADPAMNAHELQRGSDMLLARVESLEARHSGFVTAHALSFLLLYAIEDARLWFKLDPEDHLTHVLSDESPGSRFGKYMFEWSAASPLRRAAHEHALRDALLFMDELTAPIGPSLLRLAPFVPAWIQWQKNRWPEALSILSGVWQTSAPLEKLYRRMEISDGTEVEYSVEESLRAGARALEDGKVTFSAGSGAEFLCERPGMPALPENAPVEALILRADLTVAANAARQLAAYQGPDDGVLFRLCEELIEAPDDIERRRRYARRAAATPWRRVRAAPLSMLWWGARFVYGEAVPDTLDDLRDLLSEPGPLAHRSLADELTARLASGGAWADRPDGMLLAFRAAQVPGALPALLLRYRLGATRLETDIAHTLERLQSCENQPAARLMTDIIFLRAAALRQPVIQRGSDETLDLRAGLPALLTSMLAGLDQEPNPGSLAAGEANLLRLCRHIVHVLHSAELPSAPLPATDSLWLTYRLYQWLVAQLETLSERERGQAIQMLCAAAPAPTPRTDAEDLLDPSTFGRDRLDHRLHAVLFALDLVISPSFPESVVPAVSAEANAFELLDEKASGYLVKWAGRALTAEERAIRRLGQSLSILSVLMDEPSSGPWKPLGTIPDLALSVLLRSSPRRFLELRPEARMRWIDQIPASLDMPGAPPERLLSLLLSACAACAPELGEDGRMLLRRRVEQSVLPGSAGEAALFVLICLFQCGETDLRGHILKKIVSSVSELAQLDLLVGGYWIALAIHRTEPETVLADLNAILDAIRAADMDEVPYIEHILNLMIASFGDRAVIRQLIEQRLSRTDERVEALLKKLPG